MVIDLISWLLGQSEGVTRSDKCILFFVKLAWLNLRVLLRVAMGKKRRDQLYVKKELDFGAFWYLAFNFLKFHNDKSKLLRFKMPKYGYEFCCRNNKDDFKIMTAHENDIMERFCPKKWDTFVDVGAHIGLYTLMASKHVGSKGRVIAIEADPKNFKLLNMNVKLNNLPNVTTLNYAASSRQESNKKLYLSNAQAGFTKYNTIMSEWVHSQDKFVMIKADTLDNLLQMNGISCTEVNWIKIDVEGAEFEVLKGARKVLSNSNDLTILLEVHGSAHSYRVNLEQLIKLYNFRIEFEKTYEENGSMHIIIRKYIPSN